MNYSVSKQLTALLDSLDREEKSGIKQFLRSPHHNQRQELVDFAEILLDYQCSKAKHQRRLTRLADRTTKGEASKWHLLNSDLLRKIEEYLTECSERLPTIIGRQLDLKYGLRSRQQPQRVAAATRRLNRQLEKLPDGVTRSRIDYQVAWEELSEQLAVRKLTAEAANTVRELHERSTLLEALQLACESLSTRTIDSGALTPGLLPVYLNHLESGQLLATDRVLAIYYYCYRTMESVENEAAFRQLRQRLGDLPLLDEREATDILRMAINACIRRVNNNRPEFNEVALDLYDLGLEKTYLLDHGQLSRFTYSNVIALALKSDNPSRAQSFMERFSSLLPTEYAQSTEALNRARLAYHEKRLDEAMDWLQSAKDQDVLTTLNIRILQMRVYYELSEFRLLDAHLDALDIYLRRRKDSLDYHYKAYRNLVGFVRRFRRINPYDAEALKVFRKKVTSTEGLPERGWLVGIAG